MSDRLPGAATLVAAQTRYQFRLLVRTPRATVAGFALPVVLMILNNTSGRGDAQLRTLMAGMAVLGLTNISFVTHAAGLVAARESGVLRRWRASPLPAWCYFTGRIAATVALAMTGAVLLTLPVAWIYILTRAKRGYQQSVVQTLLVLPLVVAGIVVLVKFSVALAFSLAGIVAAVRFRNTLDDSKDAVYVFLATAVGLAAAVDMPVALVISFLFNLVVVLLWATDFGRTPAHLEGKTAERRLARAMEQIYRDYPDDLEAASFYSLSLLGTVQPGDRGFSRQMGAGAIALDVGNQDPFVGTNTQLAESLTRLGITQTFEVYDGDHGNRIRERFESHVLRFFSQHLNAR